MESNKFTDIDDKIVKLQLEKSKHFDEIMASKNPDDVIKAVNYISSRQKQDKGAIKGYVFSPEKEFYTGLGYKNSLKSVTYDLLRKMGTVPVVSSVITTRIEQIQNFINFTKDFDREGWTVRKKLNRFEDYKKDYNATDSDKKIIDKIATFIEQGGTYSKWEQTDDFDKFIRKFVLDSLELDQAAFEVERTRRGDLVGYTVLDGGTIRLLESIDEKSVDKTNFGDINGYDPIYCQVYNQQILKNHITKEPIYYYPWELCLSMRNPSTYIRRNGYGKSELEILVEVVTWLLWGMQYNGNFFKQGSNPKGFFTIDGSVNQDVLNEFRSAWRNTVMGVMNSHKVPIFEGDKIAWNDMQVSNKDMEFAQWNEFLILILCSVYKIDPNELGFHFRQQGQGLFGSGGQKDRLEHSKEKGLKPILRMIEKQINKYIVSEIDHRYEFAWTGINLQDETDMLENDKKKAEAGFVSMEDMFEKYSHRKFDPKKDTILNQVYQSAEQAKQFGGMESNMAVDEMTGEGEGNLFANKAEDSDPITSEAMKYINRMMYKD